MISFNLNHWRNFKPYLHFEITLKFQTENKNEIDFVFVVVIYTNSIDLILNCILRL